MNKGFSFYKVHHNEDADPYFSEWEQGGFLIACDGLGGSGSYIHEIDHINMIPRLRQAILPEYYPKKTPSLGDRFERWFDDMIKPMADDRNDTSALWASRIVIARYVYYLETNKDAELSDPAVREEIVGFIYKGLHNVFKTFGMTHSPRNEQLTLPTTLVSIRYYEREDGVVADVVWAGDSRAYALIPGVGLKQLSFDDESKDGGITNLFGMKRDEEIPTTLNYKRYRLPKKCLLFTCSDGFFDLHSPIDNLGVEAVILDRIASAENFEDFKETWYKFFKPTSHDDCSVALVSFGFDDENFAELKSLTSKRCKMTADMYNSYDENKKFIPIFLNEAESPVDYVNERAKERRDDIIGILADTLARGATDEVLVDEGIKGVCNEMAVKAAEKLAAEKKDKQYELAQGIKNDLLENAENADKTFIEQDKFSKNPFAVKVRKLLKASSEYLDRSEEACVTAKENAEKKLEEAEEKRASDIEHLKSEKARYETLASHLGELKKEAGKVVGRLNQSAALKEVRAAEKVLKTFSEQEILYKKYADYLKIFIRVLENVEKSKEFTDFKIKREEDELRYIYAVLKKEYDFTVNAFDSYCKAKKAVRDAEEKINSFHAKTEELKGKYEESVKALDEDETVWSFAQPEAYYTEEYLQKIHALNEGEAVRLSAQDVYEALNEYFTVYPEAYDAMIERLIGSMQPTVIDLKFNPSRLMVCRKFRSVDREKVMAMYEKIEQTLADSEDVSAYLEA